MSHGGGGHFGGGFGHRGFRGFGRRGYGYGGYPYYEPYYDPYAGYGGDYGGDQASQGDENLDAAMSPVIQEQIAAQSGASVGWRGGWGMDWRRRHWPVMPYGHPPVPFVPPVPLPVPEVIAQGEPGERSHIRPRNLLVEDPGPDRAGREVLPMSTGVAILPTQSAQITARPQRVAFRPERVFISAAGTSGGAADWVVNDIKIGNRSQFSQSGDVPGDMFATNAIDGFVSFETAQTAMDVVMVVTYIGLNESGVPFFASIVGTAAI